MIKDTSNKRPQIRVRGFDGDWKDNQIGEILSEVKRSIVLEDNQQYELITVKRRNEGIISRGYLFGRDILVKNYSMLEVGDFLISKRQVVHGATGIVPANLDKAIVSNEYLVATGNDDISTEFLTIISSLSEMKRKFLLSSYGVDIEKLFFDAEDWKKRTVTIPKKTEQIKICSFFKELNYLIQLHQRKYDKLVTIKKAMLQKMFPQDVAGTPDIRFNGFENDWSETTLSQEADITTGYPFDSSEFIHSGEYLVVTNGNIQNEDPFVDGAVGNRISINKSSPLTKFMLDIGDILITMDGSVGRSAKVNQEKMILAQRVGRLVAKYDTEFLYQSLNTGKFLNNMTTLSSGGTIKHISLNEIGGFTFMIPSNPEEQKKIGAYFGKIDRFIYLQRIQLNKLKQLKSACLAKMFV